MLNNLIRQKAVNIETEFNEFKDTLFNISSQTQNEKNSKQKTKNLTFKINKISLLCFDDKRFILDDDIHMLAYFHKNLRK